MAADRRAANFSGESGQSVDSSLVQSAGIAETFLAREIRELDLNNVHEPPKEILRRWLSVKSLISMACSNAIKQQEAALDAGKQVFRPIVKGFCGEVFDQVSKEPRTCAKESVHPAEPRAMERLHMPFPDL